MRREPLVASRWRSDWALSRLGPHRRDVGEDRIRRRCRRNHRAAASGALATERFHLDKSPFEAVKDTPAARVNTLARAVLDAVYETIRRHDVTYDEYNALKAWMINVGHDGGWPLSLDVWIEHVVEDVANAHREGNKGSIEGLFTCRGRRSLVR